MRVRTVIIALTCIVALGVSFSAGATGPVHQWSKRYNGHISIYPLVALAPGGDIVLVGAFTNTIDLGGGPLIGSSTFVAKLDPSGGHVWSKKLGDVTAYSVAVSPAGNILIVGNFYGTVNFGGGDLNTLGPNDGDAFAVELDANGSHIWSARFGSAGAQWGLSAAFDANGNMLIAGRTDEGSVDLGGVPLNTTHVDGWFGKFSPAGVHLWSRRIGDVSTNPADAGFDQINAIAADPSGDVLITGFFVGTVDFGNGPVIPQFQDMFVARYNASGAYVVNQVFPGDAATAAFATPQAMAIDGSGNVIIGGFYEANNEVDFGGGPLPAACQAPFLVSFRADTGHRWSHGFGRSLIDYPFCYGYCSVNSVAVNENGDVAFAGSFSDSLNVGGDWLSNPVQDCVVMAKFDTNGHHIWSRSAASRSVGTSAAVDDAGDVYVTGLFGDPINLGGYTLTAVNQRDIFLVRYGGTVVPALITRFEATPAGAGVQLRWELWSDEAIASFRLLRAEGAAAFSSIAEIADVQARSFLDTSVQPGKHYRYELAIDMRDGNIFRSPISAVTTPAPGLALGDNRPNPFNPQTTIPYQVPGSATLQRVDLRIVDTAGGLVRKLVNEDQSSGAHSFIWNGRDDHGRPVSSGVYFYVLRVGKEELAHKMVMLK